MIAHHGRCLGWDPVAVYHGFAAIAARDHFLPHCEGSMIGDVLEHFFVGDGVVDLQRLIGWAKVYGVELVHDRMGPHSPDLGVLISREDLATILGTATGSVIRCLTDLKEEGAIGTHGREIRIVDRVRL